MDKKTGDRECLKIGIAKGKDWRHVLKRATGFAKFYDVRIQKTVHGPLEDIYYLEQYLHELWAKEKHQPRHRFGGHTECFRVLPEIIQSIPKHV